MKLSRWGLIQQYAIAAVALHNSHHIGRIGYWAGSVRRRACLYTLCEMWWDPDGCPVPWS